MKNNDIEISKCIGCGLCEAVFRNNAEVRINSQGFYRPYFNEKPDMNLLNKICPLNNNSQDYSSNIWGVYESVYLGHSKDDLIREQGSSGGVITQSLIYLLDNKIVDAVIHIGASTDNPTENVIYVNSSRKEVLKNAGSRYSPSAPLTRIDEYLKLDKKYAFVGKPCDVRALRNYAKVNKHVDEKILYAFSFFCMGTPSYLGTDKLIQELGFDKNNIKDLRYRGNGWPGSATAVDDKGNSSSMSYSKSWGTITGEFLQPYCRWCADGVGEFADVSCGDAWYLDDNLKPKFDEADGRNVVFARNLKGQELLNEMIEAGVIELNDFSKDIELLKYMNYSQHHRKSTMFGKILGLKLLGRDVPYYKLSDLRAWSKETSKYKNIRSLIGTVTRGLKGKF